MIDTAKIQGTVCGFTLVETLVAVTLLTIAIAAPISLTSKSLATAYYARDQITAFHLAQEGIEAVRHVRDQNILYTALNPDEPVDILFGILSEGEDTDKFAISTIDDEIYPCDGNEGCPPLELDPTGTFYGYWDDGEETRFTRTVEVWTVDPDLNEVPQEIQVEVTVSWRTGAFKRERKVVISENLYRWVRDNTSIEEEIAEMPEEEPQGDRVTIFLTSGSGFWVIPNDWNPTDNSIEVIGGGGGGGGGNNNYRSSGGGGGGYAKVSSVSFASGSVRYSVGSGGTENVAGGDTYFCNSPTSCASITGDSVIAGAKGGSPGSSGNGANPNPAGGAGGAAADGEGDSTFSGGAGAPAIHASQNGGGGGAAGPNGNGVTATTGNGGAGGGGSGGVGGAVGYSPPTTERGGKPGGNGAEWTNSSGASGGSGGGGGATMFGGNTDGGAGGSYGAGGGGADQQFNGGTGGRGIIVISYQPL